LEENVDEENLRSEFSKYAPIKDLRLVRDKFTQASRGFAFVHFNSVQEAAKALEASNGTALEKNGQLLRVAFAKSIYGSGPSAPGSTPLQCSQAAATAIEAATFAQQYDNTGWAPKEYNPDQDVSSGHTSGTNYESTPVNNAKGLEKRYGKAIPHEARHGGQGDTDTPISRANKPGTSEEAEAPQFGFVWDEASGYYYDAASGFYYDGHRGLYYDGNTGLWYTYDQETQQYAHYVDLAPENPGDVVSDSIKSVADKAVISAPASVSLELSEKKPTLAEAVLAAAVAAQVAAKKEKERTKEKEKESRLAGKGPLMVSKKKISNAMNQWKQRQSETQAVQGPIIDGCSTAPPPGVSDVQSDTSTAASIGITSHQTTSSRFRSGNIGKDNWGPSIGRGGSLSGGIFHTPVGSGRAKPLVSNNSAMNSDSRGTTIGSPATNFSIGLGRDSAKAAARGSSESGGPPNTVPASESVTAAPFKTSASALGSYGPMAGVKRRFTETPQTGYRDRAAERRNLYGSSVQGDNSSEVDLKEKGTVSGRT
jgi:RNA-binding protein 5/10